ncbi:MAG: hypothetical protein M9933_16050 [Chitinophagaceae bacterium]|nr:hypothetical protein [Chitinophagaceae bacterium]
MHKWRFLAPLGLLAVAAAGSAIVMLLWNWLMPAVFGLSIVSFWQALGIFVLCRLLFGRFGIGRRGFGGMGNPIYEKWSKMTPEEKKEFLKKRHAGHFGQACRHDAFQNDNAEKQD